MINRKSYDLETITSAQIRAARALLRWTAEDLAKEALLGVATIRRAEANDGPLQMTASNIAAVRTAFEKSGIEFISATAEHGVGVQLRR